MTEEQHTYFEAVLLAFQKGSGPLNDWERGFLCDQHDRYEEYGETTRFSDKQWAIICRIGDKLNV
jgi:hypothetical protein